MTKRETRAKKATPKEPRPMGRPTKLTPQLQAGLVAFLEEDGIVEWGCAELGISDTTFDRWMLEGAAEDAPVEKANFRAAMARARARFEKKTWGNLLAKSNGSPRNENPPDWKADFQLLQSVNPRRYRETKRTELTGAEGGPVSVTAPVIMIPPESAD